jgi:hypothetical protein
MKILKVIQLFLLIATAIIAVLCYFDVLTFKPDNLFVIFGAVGGICAFLLEAYSRETKKFSVANVLAVGYIKNFLEPVMTQIIVEHPDKAPKFYIFIPSKISDLDDNNIARVKASLNRVSYQSETVSIAIQNQRAKNILLVSNANKHDGFYFDVPTTLSAMIALIEYQVEKRGNTSSKKMTDAIFKQYIGYFKKELIEVLKDKNLAGYVTLVNSADEIGYL